MGKYIIELPDDEHLISWWIYTGTEDGKQYIDFHEVVKTPYKEPDPEAIKQEAYRKGLEDAWECAKKISIMDSPTRDEIFGLVITSNIIDENSAPEAIEKIRQYEQEQEQQIQVGDEVNGKGGRGTIAKISDDGNHFNVMWEDGSTGYYMMEDFKKTGRNFPEIAEVLKKIKGEEE